MRVRIACDIILKLEGSIRPAAYLAEELIKRGYTVTITSPFIAEEAKRKLNEAGIIAQSLNDRFAKENSNYSFLWLKAWAYEAFFRMNSRKLREQMFTINFSQMLCIPSVAWYLQGTPTAALDDICREMPLNLKLAYKILSPIMFQADKSMINHITRMSKVVVANSKFCASMYLDYGVKADCVIYPPIDCGIFRPSTSKPSSDYVLTYFGKETEFSIIKMIASEGVKIKAFGSKAPFIPKSLLKNPNVEFLGRVSTSELVELYSNSLYTLFPFTHEPFGYIPLESMACGTPVLTYGMQGPSEYVIDGETGWLVKDGEQLIRKAVEIWEKGYSSKMRNTCVEEAMKFDKKVYSEKWFKLLNSIEEDFNWI